MVSAKRPSCVCAPECPQELQEPISYVCGSDGISYKSYCSLKRTACLIGRHISLKYQGRCRKREASTFAPTVSPTPTPSPDTQGKDA